MGCPKTCSGELWGKDVVGVGGTVIDGGCPRSGGYSDVKRHVVWSRVRMSKVVMPSSLMVGA